MHVRRLSTIALAFVISFIPAASFAAQTSADYISSIFLSGGNNYGFRIAFQNQSTLPSTCFGSFAYVNVANDNYQAFVSSLTSAYLSHKQVYIVYTPTGNYCQIVEFGVSG